MIIVGERINASRKDIHKAIIASDVTSIQKEAINQDEAGAHFIDVNAGTFIGEETEKLKWLVSIVQEVTQKPICLDSPDPEVIKAVLPYLKQAPMINSISLNPVRLESMLPVVVKSSCKVIALCQSDVSIAETPEEKIEIAGKIVKYVTSAGVPMENLYIDPLIYPLSTNSQTSVIALEAIRLIMQSFPGVHTICGLSNVSHGLPCRRLINRTFIVSAMTCGLDSAILDPNDKQLMASLKAARAINGKDEYCMEYIQAYREDRLL